MTETERYLFDLNSFLVLRNVLTPEEVQRLYNGIPRGEDGEVMQKEVLDLMTEDQKRYLKY